MHAFCLIALDLYSVPGCFVEREAATLAEIRRRLGSPACAQPFPVTSRLAYASRLDSTPFAIPILMHAFCLIALDLYSVPGCFVEREAATLAIRRRLGSPACAQPFPVTSRLAYASRLDSTPFAIPILMHAFCLIALDLYSVPGCFVEREAATLAIRRRLGSPACAQPFPVTSRLAYASRLDSTPFAIPILMHAFCLIALDLYSVPGCFVEREAATLAIRRRLGSPACAQPFPVTSRLAYASRLDSTPFAIPILMHVFCLIALDLYSVPGCFVEREAATLAIRRRLGSPACAQPFPVTSRLAYASRLDSTPFAIPILMHAFCLIALDRKWIVGHRADLFDPGRRELLQPRHVGGDHVGQVDPVTRRGRSG